MARDSPPAAVPPSTASVTSPLQGSLAPPNYCRRGKPRERQDHVREEKRRHGGEDGSRKCPSDRALGCKAAGTGLPPLSSEMSTLLPGAVLGHPSKPARIRVLSLNPSCSFSSLRSYICYSFCLEHPPSFLPSTITNSYLSFKTQLECHLFQEAFPWSVIPSCGISQCPLHLNTSLTCLLPFLYSGQGVCLVCLHTLSLYYRTWHWVEAQLLYAGMDNDNKSIF